MFRQLSDKVRYIGVDDLDCDLFESQYIVPEGISYNSYLVCDSMTAVLDTVDARKGEVWLKNLDEALEGRTLDYLVVHHMEPDHSAMIGVLLEKYSEMKIVASAKALQMIPQFFEKISLEGRTVAVKEGDVLDLGTHKLEFIAAPMIHWPEVVMSFDSSDGTLYSADAFGKFGALEKCGFYGRDDDDWSCEARRYYFNIVGKYGAQVKALLAKVSLRNVKSIRPLHGPLLEDNLEDYISLYGTWSSYMPETEGVFIACASIHGGTMEVARKLEELLSAKGMKTSLSDICRSDFAENVEDAFRYSGMILAASSYDGGLFTPMHEFLHRLQIKGYSNRTVGLVENGSWAPSAGRVMKEMLGTMKNVTVIDPIVTIRSRMKAQDMDSLCKLADIIGDATKK
ncbi:MAG: FprA family A-type flavoprotein [Bacteroidaceae bacterium]|nr:FprA family A-type flavoprotein [Bacteroidaceae bacterium]